MGEGAARVLSRAGRRSAGLGSDGGARTHTHAVGVRAYGVVCVPQTKRGGVGDGAICSVVAHTRLFDGAKVVFFFVAIQSAVEVSFAAVIKLNRNETAVERLYVNRSVCETEGSSARPKCVRIRGLPPKTGNNT